MVKLVLKFYSVHGSAWNPCWNKRAEERVERKWLREMKEEKREGWQLGRKRGIGEGMERGNELRRGEGWEGEKHSAGEAAMGWEVRDQLYNSLAAWLSCLNLSLLICEMGLATSALSSSQGLPDCRRPSVRRSFGKQSVLFNSKAAWQQKVSYFVRQVRVLVTLEGDLRCLISPLLWREACHTLQQGQCGLCL